MYVEVVVRRLQDKSHGPARVVQRSLETLQHISDDESTYPKDVLDSQKLEGAARGERLYAMDVNAWWFEVVSVPVCIKSIIHAKHSQGDGELLPVHRRGFLGYDVAPL